MAFSPASVSTAWRKVHWRKVGRLFFALLAIQMGTQVLFTSSDGKHPRAIREWRLVPYVLPMTTGQIGNPIAIVILVISNDGLLHVGMLLAMQDGRRNGKPRSGHEGVSSVIFLGPSRRQRFSNGSSGR